MAIMSGRSKRQAKVLEENYWDCSVCTYKNNAEAFKCMVCDVRKGTSTRKPRINSQLAAQQYTPAPPQKANKIENGQKEKTEKKGSPHSKSGKKSWPPPRLKNVDRSSAQTREVTVNNITVMITEYKPKVKGLASQDSSSSESSAESPSLPPSPSPSPSPSASASS